MIPAAPDAYVGQTSDITTTFVGDVMWYINTVTGQHWPANIPDNEGSETEVETEVTGVVLASGTVRMDVEDTETSESEASVLASAQALITERVRCSSRHPNTPLIVASRNRASPYTLRFLVTVNTPHPRR